MKWQGMDKVREALEFAAQHLSSEWPERCQEIVRRAREALSEQPAVPEFCCEASWREAKEVAWKERDLQCNCDHNEYCAKCWPLDFRHGGKWSQYAAPQPPAKGGVE